MFNKYLIVFLSVFILASCGAETEVKENINPEVDVKIESNTGSVDTDVSVGTWELSTSDQDALAEFEKDLDNLFSELEDE